ncbi:MAG: RNA-guided endonuclease InsQ/TnpB family protein [Bacteroidota bacterium]
MLKAYKYRLYPSKAQSLLLEQTLETCRRWYNDCLAERKEAYENEKRSVGKFEQLRKVKELKQCNPYASNVHSHILQTVVQDLDKAFQAFFRRVRAGETAGYPRFKGKNRFDSFGLKEYRNGFKIDGRRLKVSGIGRLRVRWHRPIEGEIKTVRIRRQAGKWYACFACEVCEPPLQPTGQSVGVDVGIHHLLATSDNEVVGNPRWYRKAQAKLRILQRRVSRRTKGGSNRSKVVLALQRQHEYIANSRKDFLNKVAHSLIARYDFIALEDLQIKGMVRNRRLSKSILDAGWGYLKQRLIDKAVEAGRQVVLVNPAYTSKTCSSCGMLFEGLSLADRWIECSCGLSMDRDVNAALNVLWVGQTHWGKSTDNSLRLPQEAPPLYRTCGSVQVRRQGSVTNGQSGVKYRN